MLVSQALWILGGAALMILSITGAHVVLERNRSHQDLYDSGKLWKRAFGYATEIASGDISRFEDFNKMIGQSSDKAPIISALTAVARSEDCLPIFFKFTQRSQLTDAVRENLVHRDHLKKIDALETIEVLKLENLFGEVANLSSTDDEKVAKAVCSALIVLNPSVAVGVLIGMLDKWGSWVPELLGTSADALIKRNDRRLPIARPKWRDAPLLAGKALSAGQLPEPGDASDAVALLIGMLNDSSDERRLAAVNALAGVIEHPGAQIALAGALGAEDRVTRFAVAARLVESPTGQAILERASSGDVKNDAAEVATDILWAGRIKNTLNEDEL